MELCIKNIFLDPHSLDPYRDLRKQPQLGRYSTFQYPDQDAYQYPYAEDFNADTLFHVSVTVKRIFLFYLTLSSAYIISLSLTSKCIYLLFKMW